MTASNPSVSTQSVPSAGAVIKVRTCGKGPILVLVPSLARPASDFDAFLQTLAGAGYRAVAVSLRGIEGSTGSYAGGSLRTMAADVAAVIDSLGTTPVHVIGHALGNGVVRCVATDFPDKVKSVTLLAAGGRISGKPEAMQAFARALKKPLTDAEWVRAMHDSGFFARKSDPMVWRKDWWLDVADDHRTAFNATPAEHWWAAGGKPLFIVQGLEDGVAPPDNGWAMQREFGARVTLVDLPDAGHALLPEQPAALATAVIGFLNGMEAR
jgi:pimeloyl-ACP methyl ester carboxylesterase